MEIMERQEYGFRVLALSATPGNCLERTQEIMNNLKIARIEMRQENDPEVRRHMQAKAITPILICENDSMHVITESVNEVMLKLIESLKACLTHYEDQMAVPKELQLNFYFINRYYEGFKKRSKYYESFLKKDKVNYLFNVFKVLFKLTKVNKTLADQGFLSFNTAIIDLRQFLDTSNSPSLKNELLEHPPFVKLLNNAMGVSPDQQEDHPKMQALIKILYNFFTNPITQAAKSKSIVFTNNRANAASIVDYLSVIENVRPAVFLGQGGTKKDDGSIKITQKMQIETIKKFKENHFNVLVATCVAEEGLDIGEVDLIVCYDSGLSPTRLVQRMGRTGRKRAGKVILLLNPNEYKSFKNSNKQHQQMIKELNFANKSKAFKGKNSSLEFNEKSPRMIPDDVETLELKVSDNAQINAKDISESDIETNELEEVEKLIDEIINQAKEPIAFSAKKEKSALKSLQPISSNKNKDYDF
jgi:ATP-dependent DNA helicase MPH1